MSANQPGSQGPVQGYPGYPQPSPGPVYPYPGHVPGGPGYAPYVPVRSRLQWLAYVRTCFNAGQPVAKMLYEMAAAGVSQPDAYQVVGEVIAAMRRRAQLLVAGGAIAVAVGLLVTVATMKTAQEAAYETGSGMYVVWWGPVVFGALAFIYGLRLLSKVPKLNG